MDDFQRVMWRWVRGIALLAIVTIFVLGIWEGWYEPIVDYFAKWLVATVPTPTLPVAPSQIIIEPSFTPDPVVTPTETITASPTPQ